MKFVIVAASLLFTTTASAQDADMSAPDASTTPTEAPAPEAEAAAPLTIDTPIVELMADERAKAVVEAQIPGMEQHPAYNQFKGMSLAVIQPFSEGMITDEMLAAIAAGLAELG